MREPMTRERMIEVLRVTVEDLGHRGRNTLLEWSIHNIEAVLAALEAEPPCACGGEPVAQGFMLCKKDWCDGESGFRHHPVYWFEPSAAELAKEMACEYQRVFIVPALPTEEGT